MRELFVIRGLYDTIDLVSHALEVDGDVIVQHGNVSLDGKSLEDMMKLMTNDALLIEFPAEAKEFSEYLRKTFYKPE
jgi:hypothetical protein